MKSFMEVFHTLSLEGSLYELAQFIQVSRLSMTKDHRLLYIYLYSERLIEKQYIYDIKKKIQDTLFANKKIAIQIFEKFQLSAQYTPEILFESYRESILLELKNYNITQYLILKNTKVKFVQTDKMEFTVEDNLLNRKEIYELVRVLEKIFFERCGIPCTVFPVWVEAKQRPYEIEFAKAKYIKRQNEEEFIVIEKNRKSLKPEKNFANTMATKKENIKTQNPKNSNGEYKSHFIKRELNPDVIYGRDFPDEFIKLEDIIGEMGEVNIRGQVLSVDSRFFEQSGSTLFIFALTDKTDSIMVKMYSKEEMTAQIKEVLKKGSFFKIRGLTSIDKFDGELVIGSIRGIKKCDNFFIDTRMDDAEYKRVELHCHTKMSDYDGVSGADEIVKQVAKWGMEAVAITDHGNVLGAIDGYHAADRLKDKAPKIIYGVEGYLVDDDREFIVHPGQTKLEDCFVVFDIETTGFSPIYDRIIEIGAVKIVQGKIIDRFSTFVNPEIPIPFRIEELTHINDSMVLDAPKIDKALPDFLQFCGNAAVVAHNAGFDTRFIREKAREMGKDFQPCIVDTVMVGRLLLPQLGRFKLDTVAKALGLVLENHHRAVDDAEVTAKIWIKFIEMLREQGICYLYELNGKSKLNADLIRKMNTKHIIILAKNTLGRTHLYKLISLSNIEYYSKRPRIPKSLLSKYREGLLIGSACANGEVYSAILDGESEEELRRVAMYYDYLEIQPIGNYVFMLESDRYPMQNIEDLQNINRKIVALGKDLDKPVVATGDVHFLNPEDEIYRRILYYGKGFENADNQAPLYLRTTKEMLEEFIYLGEEKAYEVVVENTRKIADMVEFIKPVRPDKCPPMIDNSDEILTEACYKKAHEQYGENLPFIVQNRLEKELNSIIKNGFAVMYIIAKNLVEKSNQDGYLVGSRGSVGSSFAAYASGITEVNPLPAHYYCDCKYVDFDSPELKENAGIAGCDMPDKNCPNCGKKLKKDGFDIPFETFLGFKGDKEPDIDLNFSGEYQSTAHDYTEVLFGKGHTYRAGTTGTIAEKTAFGFVKKYFEEHGIHKRKAEIERIAKGCVGVKRTTGQHPGGIIVLPHGEEIYSFTPIQKPADDMKSKIVTTQFDYHAIDHNLLKLDILGHQDPTMIRMLQDLIGIDPVKDIPMDSKETMSLFQNTSALGVKPEEILGCQLGARGIPEFGTDFAIQMLIDAKPLGFSDLIRISGLSHGEDVWVGNALTLIQEGKATIRSCICTRDDIMGYLISKGMDESLSFKIMESVRKGKGLTPDWEKAMLEAKVPDWYIWSCKKIKYMFPKAHAAAYVMMAWRIAYCKIFYPIEYYTAYFTIRATGFSYEMMCFGKNKVEILIAQLDKGKSGKSEEKEIEEEQNIDTGKSKDKAILRDLKIVQEMYARGFLFERINIYQAKAMQFIITKDRKIMPSLSSIDGLGEVAAKQIEIAAKQGKFISKDDFMQRAKVGKSTCELMDKFGLLGDIPESNQMSLFDMGF